MLLEVSLEGLPSDVVEGNDPGVVLEVGAFVEVVVDLGLDGLEQLLLHFVHVNLRVAYLNGLSDGVQPE